MARKVKVKRKAAGSASRKTSQRSKTKKKSRKFPIEILTDDEMTRLFDQCNTRYPTGLRNRALLVMGFRGGLRIAEALSLYPKDVNLKTGEVNIQHGKGDKQRLVFIDKQACEILRWWIDRRQALGFKQDQPLFCTIGRDKKGERRGGEMKTAYVRVLLPRLARKAGILKRVHYHALRHFFASALAAERTPLRGISGLLGHESLVTTQNYLKKVAPEELRDIIRNRPSWKK